MPKDMKPKKKGEENINTHTILAGRYISITQDFLSISPQNKS